MVLTNTILMVRPAQFTYNAETAETNAFQNKIDQSESETVRVNAFQEFDALVQKLRANHINVLVYEDTPEPLKPDAVFPNNWITTHLDGTIALYPMCHENRRTERREDIVEDLKSKYTVNRIEDFSYFEVSRQYMEGTGSMVLDREHKIIYACLSPRTDKEALETIGDKLGFKVIAFHSVDEKDQEIYHTNVMMSMGTDFVVICMDSIRNEEEKQILLDTFQDTGKELIEISYDQMNRMAGNMITLKDNNGDVVEVMSEQAYYSLNDRQLTQLLTHCKIVYSNIETIETYGGGSARCMIAEVFL